MRVDDIPLLSTCIAFSLSHDGNFTLTYYYPFLVFLACSFLVSHLFFPLSHYSPHRLARTTYPRVGTSALNIREIPVSVHPVRTL